MKIALFTSNNPRHLSLAERLSGIADTVYMVQECTTVFPGKIDDYYRKSPTMQEYFARVIAAERNVFGEPRFLPTNVRQLAFRMEDISLASIDILSPALEADVIIVFGASWIRGPLIDRLIEKKALNIHMGVSPYYRGSSCNFWALYDGNPNLVGATIHMLSKGLDSGDMLYHAKPKNEAVDPFVFGMKAVEAAQKSLVDLIQSSELFMLPTMKQDKAGEIRYTRNAEFTDEVAREYLDRELDGAWLSSRLNESRELEFFNLYTPRDSLAT